MTNKTRLTLLIAYDWFRCSVSIVALATVFVILCAAKWIYVSPWPIKGYFYRGSWDCAIYFRGNDCVKR